MEEFEVVIMIAVRDRRDAWVGPSSWPERLQASLGWKRQTIQRERNGALLRVLAGVCAKSAWHRRHCQRGLVSSTIDLSPST